MEVTVLDIGSKKISAYVGKDSVNMQLAVVARGECEYAGFVEGNFLEPDKLAQCITEALIKLPNSSSIKKVTVGLPGEFCFGSVQDIQHSLDRRRKILDSDILELHSKGVSKLQKPDVQVINIQPIAYMLDKTTRTLNPEGMTASSILGRISYTLCHTHYTNKISDILKSLGVVEVEFCSSVVAESLFLLNEAQRDKGAILVDCGYLTTTVAILKGDGLLAQCSFSVGGAHIAADFYTYMDIPFDIAEKLKQDIKLSLAYKEDDCYEVTQNFIKYKYSCKLINAIATERINAVANTIKEILKTHDTSVQNYNIYLTGGGFSFVRGAKDIFSKAIGKNVEVLAPNVQEYNKPDQSSSMGLLSMALKAAEVSQSSTVSTSRRGILAKIFK